MKRRVGGVGGRGGDEVREGAGPGCRSRSGGGCPRRGLGMAEEVGDARGGWEDSEGEEVD